MTTKLITVFSADGKELGATTDPEQVKEYIANNPGCKSSTQIFTQGAEVPQYKPLLAVTQS